MSSAITPKLVLVGTSGSGKTTIAREIAARCGLSLTEDIDILQSEYSRSFDELIADEDFPFDRALEEAGERLLSGVCDIAVLSPSQARHQKIIDRLIALKKQGSAVVLLQLPIDQAARRVGLNAPRSVGLGAPRSLFAMMTRELDRTYLEFASFSCDTGLKTPSEVAENIIVACKMATV